MNLGQVAPTIEVKDTSGHLFSSVKQVEQGPLVVAFYPLAFTGG